MQLLRSYGFVLIIFRSLGLAECGMEQTIEELLTALNLMPIRREKEQS